MDLKERLLSFIDYKGIAKQEFEIKAGLSNGAISKMGDNTRTSTLDKISNAFPELNINWLRTGEGPMLSSAERDPSAASGTSPTTVSRLLDELAAQRRLTERAQEQVTKSQQHIDRLIALLEKEKGAAIAG